MNTLEITVRPWRTGDGEGLASAWLDAARYYAELAPDTFRVPDADGLPEFFERRMAEDGEAGELHLVAEVGDQVVASAWARIEPPVDSARYQLQRQLTQTRLIVDGIVVAEAFRRSGVGVRLMDALETWGRERGATVALLDTYPESAVSLPFFQERMGYRRRSLRLLKAL